MKTFNQFRKDIIESVEPSDEKILPASLEGMSEEEFDEDEGGAPTNSAGGGQVAGIGVGPSGEPGVPPRKLKLVNGPAVDPRMFRDKIFKRTLPVAESEEHKQLAADIHSFLAKHGKRSAHEPDEWNCPDAGELESAAHDIHNGVKLPRVPWSDWSSGGYRPYNDPKARKAHDDLIHRIKQHMNKQSVTESLIEIQRL
jgi:hypothetical protein